MKVNKVPLPPPPPPATIILELTADESQQLESELFHADTPAGTEMFALWAHLNHVNRS